RKGAGMGSPGELRSMSEVLLLGNFAAAMAERLDANSFKTGWQQMTAGALLRRLKQEVGELDRALKSGADAQRITQEAADVANFAAMIADVVREQSMDDES